MSLYVSYVVGSSFAVYLGNRIYRGAMVSDIDVNETENKDESAENKYIVKDNGDEVEIQSQLEINEKVNDIVEELVEDVVKDAVKDAVKDVVTDKVKKEVKIVSKPMGEMTQTGEKLYRCSKCDEMLREKLFSKTQRRKALSLWKCKVCAKLG